MDLKFGQDEDDDEGGNRAKREDVQEEMRVLCSEVSVEEDSESKADGRAVLCLHIWLMLRVELNCRPGGRSCRRSADSDMRRRWN